MKYLRAVADVLRSDAARVMFLILALAGAVWALVSQWDAFSAAITNFSIWQVLVAFLLSIAFMFVVMLCWRAVIIDLGSQLGLGSAANLYFVSQLGKYLPGGVWNFLAIAEMGKDLGVPRTRSLISTIVSILISIVSAGIIAVPGIIALQVIPDPYGWVMLIALPILVVFLIPDVLNRLINLALKITKRPELAQPFSGRGIIASTLWSSLSWILAGGCVYLLAGQLGADQSFRGFIGATGAYSLAWAVGFLIFFVPAGIGVREVVLGAMLADQLEPGAIIAVVLVTRVLVTLADILLACVFVVINRAAAHRRRRVA